ncbi:hypothetical protein CDAR_607551 [Caerostris darwini]|uniref:Uncharacterized protein n=1 Tax=Caerostris darwini TaxID=1538125 RepID=A0AAV4RFV9_9ARAC|nr:hypothetical protein CDAR_607551 [Caerostris darwini]
MSQDIPLRITQDTSMFYVTPSQIIRSVRGPLNSFLNSAQYMLATLRDKVGEKEPNTWPTELVSKYGALMLATLGDKVGEKEPKYLTPSADKCASDTGVVSDQKIALVKNEKWLH